VSVKVANIFFLGWGLTVSVMCCHSGFSSGDIRPSKSEKGRNSELILKGENSRDEMHILW